MGENRTTLIAVLGLIAVAVVAWLAFGFFGIQAAFIDNEVSEEGPVFASQAEQDEFDEAMEEAADDITSVDEETMPGDVVTLFSGQFAGTPSYTVTGDAMVLNDGTEQRFLRLENFNSDNGPDLNVYLRADDGDFIDLGDLKGNIGDQNYEIPVDADLETYNSVEIWCVRFGVLFGNATLAA